jgi:hypothetical protein
MRAPLRSGVLKLEIRLMSREVTFRDSIDWIPLKKEWKQIAEPAICRIHDLAAAFLEARHVSIYQFEKMASDSFGGCKNRIE